ncbi:MAG: GIY-YIG nuclease family protein [Bacteroidales bacterium]|nr:GIY-YIG nuclease family protein [Bacteroidales bacterium]
MDRLIKIGFAKVGIWESLNSNQIQFVLNSNHFTKDLLYSFIIDGEIKYIGKTIQSLCDRMNGYKNPGTSQTTNIRINKVIKGLLNHGNIVDIFILADNGLLSFGGFRINLAAGLEDTLIKEINPEWNMKGKEKIKEDKESDNPDFTSKPIKRENIKTLDSFELTLGSSYFGKGFINVPVSHSNLLAGDTEIMELVLGEEKETVHGSINRRANKGGNPRIMGGVPLRDWFQRIFKQDETIKVTIVSPTSLWFTKA